MERSLGALIGSIHQDRVHQEKKIADTLELFASACSTVASHLGVFDFDSVISQTKSFSNSVKLLKEATPQVSRRIFK